MLRYFHSVWHRWQKEHHGRETEEKQTRANMKHHFSCTKHTGWICWGQQTRVIYKTVSSWGQKRVCLSDFWFGINFSSPLPFSPLPAPLLPSPPLLLSLNDRPTTSPLPSYPHDKIDRKSCRSSRPLRDLYSVVVHFVELWKHSVKLTFQNTCSWYASPFAILRHYSSLFFFFAFSLSFQSYFPLWWLQTARQTKKKEI